jgi:hypothetical protein
VFGNIDDNYHRHPARRSNRRVNEIDPSAWTPKLDFIGVNYYRAAYVFRNEPFAAATGLIWGGAYWNDLRLHHADEPGHNLLNDLGWEICPEGLYALLMHLHNDYRGLPLMITENGIPEDFDRNRAGYIVSHLDEMLRAQAQGARILGYIHWSLLDNWEWHEGYRAKARFGLFTIPGLDGSDGALPREITEGAFALRAVIAENGAIQPAVYRFGMIDPTGDHVIPPTMSSGAIWEGDLAVGALSPVPITLHFTTQHSGYADRHDLLPQPAAMGASGRSALERGEWAPALFAQSGACIAGIQDPGARV